MLRRVSTNYDIEKKIVVFSADNAPVNFGTVGRTGSRNVLKQLKDKTNANMIGAGCTAHILHNSIETACDGLRLDVEYYAVKIYTHFYRHTVRLRKLKEFCDSIGENFVRLEEYSKTRFLALKECLSSIISNFNALNEYFDSLEEPPAKIKDFFDDPFALVSLIFVRDQSANFQNAILKLEGDNVSAVEAADTINQLKTNIESRLNNNYTSPEFKNAYEGIDASTKEKREFVTSLKAFHQTTLTYLSEWTKWLDDIKVFSWVLLKVKLKWEHVECAALWMIGRNYFSSNDMNTLFDQFALVEKYLNGKNALEGGVQEKWTKIFRDLHEKGLPYEVFSKIVEFGLVIPATNATAERVFSYINDIWTPEKGKLTIENVRARLMVKFNWEESCLDFHQKIKDDTDFLNKIRSSDKYSLNAADLFGNSNSEPVASTSTANVNE